jgi:hypothetical protein
MSLMGTAWQWIPTMSSASVFHGFGSHFLAADELHSLTAGSRLSSLRERGRKYSRSVDESEKWWEK